MKTQSIRQLRVANEIREALSHIILFGDLLPPNIDSNAISITSVQVASDLRAVYVSIVCRNVAITEDVVKNLKQQSRYLLHALLKKVKLRYAPILNFKSGEKIREKQEESAKLEILIEEANKRNNNR